ncbi:MAG: DUF2911 domain-containing protein, partial [Saprospiraceae bacterium]|nr:DUF2911 domain-containing protein [Saprospiraceae bacterium]
MPSTKTFATLLIFTFCLVTACQTPSDDGSAAEESAHVHEPAPAGGEEQKKPLSPHTTAMANIGDTHVHIDYSSPGVRGRVIWGGLVAYDQIWVAGAHNATWVEFYDDVKVNSNDVPKGKYALFLIPGREEWTVVLNQNFNQHLTDDYDPALDVLRFTVQPEFVEEVQESLSWKVVPGDGNRGQITFAW